MPPLTHARLRDAVRRGVVAIRSRTTLTPAGGTSDKVFPPTYAIERGAETRYALETRRINGQAVPCVLLDSVASQANRMEQALLEGWEDGELHFPVITVDFTEVEGLEDLGHITTLDAPHRIADALLRDSVLDGVPFRATELGRSFTDATVRNATPMYRVCPHALIFGVWDSTGPKGGSGAKFQRALVSEIVGIGVETGVKTASRLDPAGIQSGVPVYQAEADPTDWVVDAALAATEGKKKQPSLFSRKGGQGKGKPSVINHGNIAPSIDRDAGGVTLDRAEQTTVLSLAALRRLRFPCGVDDSPLEADARKEAEVSARTALAALALAAMVYQREQGYDLRSRALLVPDGPLVLELLPADGDEPESVTLDLEGAAALLTQAHAQASEQGLGWERQPAILRPAPKLASLIRHSRALTSEGDTTDDEAG
ncbi:MAG TPA: type I-U CRISPR-associated protein Cas7 [Deltaproteobacteria bacterium]|nr:type I-U CRISPR-associated protein Cas7 [Deltaproteobacteria bacterium]